MKATLRFSKPNKDGTVALYLEPGADRKALIDLEGKAIDITEDTDDCTPSPEAQVMAEFVYGKVREILEFVKREKKEEGNDTPGHTPAE